MEEGLSKNGKESYVDGMLVGAHDAGCNVVGAAEGVAVLEMAMEGARLGLSLMK